MEEGYEFYADLISQSGHAPQNPEASLSLSSVTIPSAAVRATVLTASAWPVQRKRHQRPRRHSASPVREKTLEAALAAVGYTLKRTNSLVHGKGSSDKTMATKSVSNYLPALDRANATWSNPQTKVRKHNERFVVGRRGEAQAVIMSVEDYLKHFAAEASDLKSVQRTAKKLGTHKISTKANENRDSSVIAGNAA